MKTFFLNRDFNLIIKEEPPSLEAVRVLSRPPAANTLTDEGSANPGLRISFKIEKNLARDPNKADITVYNLSKETRAKIQKKNTPVILEVGYVGNVAQIFSGVIQFVNHVKDGPDWMTTFQTSDGGDQYSSVRINESFGPGADFKSVLKKSFESMTGIGIGNAIDKINLSALRGMGQFGKGVSLSGKSSDIIDMLTRAAGLEWSIQDGHFQVLEQGEATTDDAILLNEGHGLIGSPEFGEDKLNQPVIKVKSLLNASIRAGRLVKVESNAVNGFFRVESVVHTGDTFANDWYSNFEAVEKK